jgi:hypothetical protein
MTDGLPSYKLELLEEGQALLDCHVRLQVLKPNGSIFGLQPNRSTLGLHQHVCPGPAREYICYLVPFFPLDHPLAPIDSSVGELRFDLFANGHAMGLFDMPCFRLSI